MSTLWQSMSYTAAIKLQVVNTAEKLGRRSSLVMWHQTLCIFALPKAVLCPVEVKIWSVQVLLVM